MTQTSANVLVIMADEHQAAAMSCAGHAHVRTPNLDRLAARGTIFTNAYTPSPICVPARAALATGRYVHQTGYWDIAHAYDGRIPGWGHHLGAYGIPLTSIGKLHYRREEDPVGISRQILPMNIQGGIGQVWGSVRNPLPETRSVTGMLGKIGAGLSRSNQYDINIAQAAARWLHEPDRKTGRWAAFVSFVAPHFPLTVPQEYLDLYPAAAMPLPDPSRSGGYEPHPWVARMCDMEDSDAELGSDTRRREAIAAYYALCSFVDAQIGLVLDALDASGQADNTFVIYTSDHGDCLGKRGRWGKSVLYREATQVPMILSGLGLQEGCEVSTAVSLLDIAPTLTDALGLPQDRGWVGRSLFDVAAAADDHDRWVFSEYHAANSPSAGFMLASARWKYHAYVGYPDELFDLTLDPGELNNLATAKRYSPVRDRMNKLLYDICDPSKVDAVAKADQDQLVARFGGRDIALETGPSGASPTP